MKVCDLTQFYSPVSGGVKRYVSEKVRHIRERTEGDEHVLIIPPGAEAVLPPALRDKPAPAKPPLEQWLDLFFGP